MKRRLLLTLALLLLTGCAANRTAEVFYVEDSVPETAAVFSIRFGVPSDAVPAASDDGLSETYNAEDGSYQIRTRILPGFAALQAMQALSGEADPRPIRTSRFGMQEYRFCWCTEEDGAALLHTGSVLEADDACYCLVFTSPEDRARDCRETRRQVLESFSLFEDEGF